MKRILLLLIVFIFVQVFVNAQDLYFGFQWGMGSYKMEDLKKFNDYVESQNILTTTHIDDYPEYFYCKPALHVRFHQADLRFLYSFQSTGSRYSLKDYSGEYLYDTQIKSNGPALAAAFIINPDSKFQVSLSGELGIYFSSLKLINELVVDKFAVVDETFYLKATNAYFEPGIQLAYLWSILEFHCNVSYVRQFGGKGFHRAGNKDAILYGKSKSDPVNPDWSGYRLGIGVRINMSML